MKDRNEAKKGDIIYFITYKNGLPMIHSRKILKIDLTPGVMFTICIGKGENDWLGYWQCFLSKKEAIEEQLKSTRVLVNMVEDNYKRELMRIGALQSYLEAAND